MNLNEDRTLNVNVDKIRSLNEDRTFIGCTCVGCCSVMLIQDVSDTEPFSPEMMIEVYREYRNHDRLFWRFRAAWRAFTENRWGGCELIFERKEIEQLRDACVKVLANRQTDERIGDDK